MITLFAFREIYPDVFVEFRDNGVYLYVCPCRREEYLQAFNLRDYRVRDKCGAFLILDKIETIA